MRLSELPTPALIVDKDVMERNAQSMLARARALNLAFRPNIKTHKCAEFAEMQHTGMLALPNQSGGADRSAMRVCTSTLLETRFFLEQGFGDVLYAVPLAGTKVDQIARELVLKYGPRVSFMVDSEEGVAALPQLSLPWQVFVKVDCGYGRAGRAGEALRKVVDAVQNAEARVRLRGMYTHAGHSYHTGPGVPPLEQQAAAEARAMVSVKKNDLIVSVGATPTASRPASKEEYRHVDEIHPGNYVFYDAMQIQIGSCQVNDAACSVLTTVIGVYPERGTALCDAGSRALGKDALELPSKSPWGIVIGRENINLVRISQEVGILDGEGVKDLRVGDVLRIIPNHSCLTATNFSTYHVVTGDQVFGVYTPAPRGFV